ncbi:MAG: glycoside hydrolase family 2, partial [Clostridia bacterium]|nr:glycoside hydrolase family 2 [Clostridia bacterium]
GARAYYKDPFYKDATASFIGEAGFHGCPSPESIRQFIPADSLYPLHNRYYAAHSTEDLRLCEGHDRNIMMTKHVKILFGQVPDTLEEFAALSQISQAEAFKFFIERTRALKWRRSGIIWWNMIDGWPQISDAVVDYYYRKKLAFDWIRASQRPVLAFVGELSGWEAPLILSNDTRQTARVDVRVTDHETGEILYEGARTVPAGENVTAAGLRLFASDKKLLLIDYSVNGKRYHNHYIAGNPPFDAPTMLRWVDEIKKRLAES